MWPAESSAGCSSPTMVAALAVALVTSLAGLLLGAVIDVPCSAVIVLIMAGVFLLAKLAAALLPRRSE